MSRLKNTIKHLIRRISSSIICLIYKKQYKRLLKRQNIPNKSVVGEQIWIDKWSALGKPNTVYYRLFSHYIGQDINIIPEDICRNIVEPILSPLRYVSYYSDKNIFDKLFGYDVLPQTLFRKMHGFYYDKEYKRIDIQTNEQLLNILNDADCGKIVIKPTVDSCSGDNVRLFERSDAQWFEIGSGQALNLTYLNHYYGENIIVQECVEQSGSMSYFNNTSVNTLRLTVYRSVVTDECHVPSAILRIGKTGSLVDNAHAGGGFVGIKLDGTLCNKVLNQYGETTTTFNGIDFTKVHKIPNWDKIVEFAKRIGRNVPHHRLLALDIMVDKVGNPRLIEFNCDAYSMWLFQFTVGSAFGEYTDEIIEYCKDNLDKAQKIIKA